MSIAGGFDRACERAAELGIRALQVFTTNQRQWHHPALEDGAVRAFRAARERFGIAAAFAHASYLVNLAADGALGRRSIAALRDELDRCEALGLSFLVVHPGSATAGRPQEAERRVVRALDEIHRGTPGYRTRILLETAAGQGRTLGARFESLAAMLDGAREPERLGVCFDTCHVFAAGYDMRARDTYDATMEEFDKVVGLDRIEAFHLNDSKKGLGCRVDRHEHIGRGALGQEAFRVLLHDPRWAGKPMVLETPKEGDMDRENLRVLQSLAG
jgi:deoxyribonuclease-4